MPRIQSLVPLLRPLAAPRAVTCQQHFRFSTASRRFAPKAPSTPQAAQRAADLAAAEAITEADSAQPPEPKPTLPSKRPRTPKSKTAETLDALSVRTAPRTPNSKTAEPLDALSVLKAPTPAPKTRFRKNKIIQTPPAPRAPQTDLPPPRYHISRSATKNLPVYTDYKRGGNLHLTTIRKITGDLAALRDELRVFLNKKDEDVNVNTLTGHVVVKGHHPAEIGDFLKARGM